MLSANLIDRMDVLRPEPLVDVEPPAVADDFAHLRNDVQGDEDGEEVTLEDQPCRLFEKVQTEIREGAQVVIVKQTVYCEVCDIQAWDRLHLTPKDETVRTFVVRNRRKIPGLAGIEGYSLLVEEVN